MPEQKIVTYVAELDADVDDVIAAKWLHAKGILREVVLDPPPKTDTGKKRLTELKALGVTVSDRLRTPADHVFCGGALTEVARYTAAHPIKTLVMNGGFVGGNLMDPKDALEKFKGRKTVRTFNFNCDATAADRVLRTRETQIGKIVLVGKNVCHDQRNTKAGIWGNLPCRELPDINNVKPDKRLHDLLACHEGACLLGLIDDGPYCRFMDVKPYNLGLRGRNTEWGSKPSNDGSTPYRTVSAAVGWQS